MSKKLKIPATVRSMVHPHKHLVTMLKEHHPDALAAVIAGDSLYFYGADADTVSRLIGSEITSLADEHQTAFPRIDWQKHAVVLYDHGLCVAVAVDDASTYQHRAKRSQQERATDRQQRKVSVPHGES